MNQWVDFAGIKQNVGLSVVLRQYHVRLRRSGRDQYRGRCPLHGGESREAFHANLTRNVFHCFSCGAAGTVLDFVAAMEQCTLRDAALKLERQATVPSRPALPDNRKELVTKKPNAPRPLGFTLRGINHAHPYLAARGMDQRTIEEFGVGFYRGTGLFSGRLVIPIHNQTGELVAYCGRALDGSQPRYRFPSGFSKSQVLFNLHRAAASGKRVVVVVEGFFDCFHLHQAGVRSVVALMGSALYESQQRALLDRFQRVILLLDGDPAGQRATAEIAARLRPHCSLLVIHLPLDAQPDRLTSSDIRQLLHAHSQPRKAETAWQIQ